MNRPFNCFGFFVCYDGSCYFNAALFVFLFVVKLFSVITALLWYINSIELIKIKMLLDKTTWGKMA